MICMPIPHRPIARTEPSPKAASAEILQVGGLWEGASMRDGYDETMYKGLMGLGSLAARNDFTPLKKPPPKREPFFTRSK